MEEAKAFVEKEDVVVVGFFESAESDAAKAYISAADTQDTIYFGISTSKEVAEALETTQDSIVVFKKVCVCAHVCSGVCFCFCQGVSVGVYVAVILF